MENPTAKPCTKCREVKALEAFSPGIGRYGRISKCRSCRNTLRKPALRPKRERTKPTPRPQPPKRAYSQNPRKDLRRFQELSRRASRLGVQVIGFTLTELGQRAQVFGNRCWMCQDAWTDWDHVKPLSRGGAHCLANLRPACGPCNSRKSSTWHGVRWAVSLSG